MFSIEAKVKFERYSEKIEFNFDELCAFSRGLHVLTNTRDKEVQSANNRVQQPHYYRKLDITSCKFTKTNSEAQSFTIETKVRF